MAYEGLVKYPMGRIILFVSLILKKLLLQYWKSNDTPMLSEWKNQMLHFLNIEQIWTPKETTWQYLKSYGAESYKHWKQNWVWIRWEHVGLSKCDVINVSLNLCCEMLSCLFVFFLCMFLHGLKIKIKLDKKHNKKIHTVGFPIPSILLTVLACFFIPLNVVLFK